MTWLALFLLGCAVADLVARPSVRPVGAEVGGAGAVVVVGLLAGQTDAAGLVALAVAAVLVVLWRRTAARAADSGPAALPLAILGGGVALGLITSGLAQPVGDPFARWWSSLAWPLAHAFDPGQALLVIAILLAAAEHREHRRPTRAHGDRHRPPGSAPAATDPGDPSLELKGGRLLGPMERLLIVGLGLAGNLTAASIVVAAKGLLRFPELSSRKEQEQVHRLTEYFLVGSFVSWLLALGSLALLAG